MQPLQTGWDNRGLLPWCVLIFYDPPTHPSPPVQPHLYPACLSHTHTQTHTPEPHTELPHWLHHTFLSLIKLPSFFTPGLPSLWTAYINFSLSSINLNCSDCPPSTCLTPPASQPRLSAIMPTTSPPTLLFSPTSAGNYLVSPVDALHPGKDLHCEWKKKKTQSSVSVLMYRQQHTTHGVKGVSDFLQKKLGIKLFWCDFLDWFL